MDNESIQQNTKYSVCMFYLNMFREYIIVSKLALSIIIKQKAVRSRIFLDDHRKSPHIFEKIKS